MIGGCGVGSTLRSEKSVPGGFWDPAHPWSSSTVVEVQSRQGPKVASPQPSSNRGPAPEEVVSSARARVAKMEAAMSALGESDPTTFPRCRRR